MKDQDKISIIKNLRFLTNSQTEWDERYGHLKKDHKAAMELVRKECAANYPYVDIDDFLESYMHFDNAPLRTSLTGSRISPKQWNMRDEDTFVSVMRHLVLRNQSPYPRVGRRDILELLEQEDPAITFLVYFHPDGHTKISFTPDNAMKELVNRPFSHFEAVDLSEDTDTAEFDLIDQEIARMEQEARTEEAETEPTQPEPETETEVPDSNTHL